MDLSIIESIVLIFAGTFIGYFVNVKKDKQRFINELKITTASKFIALAHESLKHLTVDISITEAYEDKFELIKLSEVIGLIFKPDTYKMIDDYIGEFSMSIQSYKDQKQSGKKRQQRKEITDLRKELIDIRADLRTQCKNNFLKFWV